MKKNGLFCWWMWLLLPAVPMLGQHAAPFQIGLESFEIVGLPGLQSYAVGQHAGKWLMVGGRLDGLHRRQPFASFNAAGRNTKIYVADPATRQVWSASIDALPAAVREQLSSTNMQFLQRGEQLYLVGGYGFSETAGEHRTFGSLVAVHVPAVVQAVVSGNALLAAHFRQVNDPQFAVTGGKLVVANGIFHLVGGHEFQGRYNPVGPNQGPGFFQKYTEQARRFRLLDDGSQLKIEHLTPLTDTDALHRRDFNVLPQILPDGGQSIMAFSGVFQKTVDFPYLSAVQIDSHRVQVVPQFSQYFNHYHCPTLPLFDGHTGEMHTLFFGGIAQFYQNNGVLVQDNNVPFVRTIARVTRLPDGSMQEFRLPLEMPSLLGAGAEFIPLENLPKFDNEVVKLHDLPTDSVLIGYIFGGIASTAPNIFFQNEGDLSTADRRIFKVFLKKNSPTPAHEPNEQSLSALRFQVFPNPSNGNFSLSFFLEKQQPAWLTVANATTGQVLLPREELTHLTVGKNVFARKLEGLVAGTMLIATLETATERAVLKILVEEI